MLIVAMVLAATVPPPAASAAVALAPTPLTGWSTNGTVYAVKVHGDTVYFGGTFTQVRSPGGATQTRNNLAAISLSSGNILPFRADTNNQVRAIDTDGATVWIGGLFSTVGGAYQRRVAAVDAVTGTRRAAFHPDPDNILWALDYSEAEGALYIGGTFTAVDGVPAGRVAKLDPVTGTPDPAFQAGASAAVRGIAVDSDGGEVWVAGTFTSIGGTGRDYLSAVHADTGVGVGAALQLVSAPLLAVDVTPDGSTVFGAVAGLQNRAQAWNTATGARRWFQQAMGDAQAVSYHDGTLYFGFHEGFAGDTTVRLLAADALTGVLDPSFRPTIDSFYGVWALDASAGGLAAGGTFTVVNGVSTRGVAVFPPSVAPDTTAPSTPGALQATAVGATSIALSWAAATDDVGVAGYRVTRDGAEIGTTTALTFTDTGLSPSSSYTYEVRAFDGADNTGSPSSATLSTAADTTPPSAPSGLATVSVASDSLSLTWTGAVDDVGVTEYEVLRDGSVIGATGGTSFSDSGLAPSTSYSYQVRARDGAGNVGEASSALSVTTAGLPDTDPPSQTTGLRIDESTVVSVTLGWEPASDEVGVIGYEVARNGAVAGSTAGVSFSDTGLTPDTAYEYTVRAFDAAGNRGDWSEPVSANTPADTTPPSQPGGLTVGGTAASSVTLSWTASTDDVGVVAYAVRRDGVEVATTASTTFTDTGLPPGGNWAYTVSSRDAAGNESTPAGPVVGSTTASNIQLVAAGSVWRYLDNGSNQGTAWRVPSFDDSAWATGAAELGYGDNDEVTVVASGPAGNVFITTYFRHHVAIADADAITGLRLLLKRDDGAVVYVNGVEVVRSNLPTGTVTHLTRAPSGVNGAAERTWFAFTIPASTLVDGDNVIAVEVHQNAPNSSDASFDLQLIGNPS